MYQPQPHHLFHHHHPQYYQSVISILIVIKTILKKCFFLPKRKLYILFSLNSQMQFPVNMQALFAANTSTYFALFQKFCDHREEGGGSRLCKGFQSRWSWSFCKLILFRRGLCSLLPAFIFIFKALRTRQVTLSLESNPKLKRMCFYYNYWNEN